MVGVTYPNIFTAVFTETTTDRRLTFEISTRKNEWKQLKEFLLSNIKLIGYNNLGFDYPIIHQMLDKDEIKVEETYSIAQEVIESDYPNIYNPVVPQLDLYKIHHYDNMARSCSLKWLEFSLRWKKVQDLPFKPGAIIPVEEFDNIMKYCINDVEFTKEVYLKSLNAINFRINTSEKLDHNVMNYSDVKIGDYINRITYEKLSGRNYKSFKDKRTYHKNFKLDDIISPLVKFKSKPFKEFFESIKGQSFKSDEKFDRYIHLPGMTLKFAKGGLHSEDEPRLVKNTKGYLSELDIGSMYPWTIVSDGIYPRHLGPEWNEGIKKSYFYRADVLKPKLKTLEKGTAEYDRIDAEQGVYKLSLNGGGFGKLGSSFNWQYDELAKYKVTINGELKMLMLIEELYIAGIELISVNTDGVVIHYTKAERDIVLKIWKDWEELTTYTLEDTYYNKLIFSSVNDYIAEIIDPDTKEVLYNKYKGEFEIDKEWHKNNSQRIVPIALSEYFIKGIPVEETIKKHRDYI